MNRLSLLFLLALSGACLEAQTSSTITISTSPSGARFLVDGTLHNSAVTMNWPKGSVHTVVFLTDPVLGGGVSVVQTSLDGGTTWALNGWLDNLGLLQPILDPVQVITADPAITTLTAQLTVAYRIRLDFFTPNNPNDSVLPPLCGAPGAIPAGQFRPGVVFINTQCFWSSATVFLPADTLITLNAYPYPGFRIYRMVTEWGEPELVSHTITLNEAINITPFFEAGKLVTFMTSPIGMDVFVDHTQVHTRTINDIPACPHNETQPVIVETGFPPLCYGDFYFAPNSSHFLSGVSPQRDDLGKWWVFNGWSDGQCAELAV